MNLDAPRLSRVETLIPLKKTNTVFSIIAGVMFCLLLGCGGSGNATSSVTGNPVIEPTPEPIDTVCQPGEECQNVELPQPPNVPDNPGTEPDEPGGPVITLPAGLLNEKKFSLVKAQEAWEKDENGYTGRKVVIGVMEEVNPFHVLFGSGDDSKIHPASVLTSPYPDNIPPPPDKYIANNEDDLIVNDKSQTGSDRMKKYPPVPCLLQFGGVENCPDTSGNTKYFLRLDEGGLGVLPGLVSPNPDEHECPVFLIKEDEDPRELCSQFGALHGTGVAGVAAANSDFLPSGGNGGQSQTRFQGVAYGADILVYARSLEIAGLPSGLEKHAAYFRNAPAQADVYTFSHTFSMEVTRRHISGRDTINLNDFALIADAIRDKDIPVIAATGNHDESVPRFPAALPLFFPDLRGQILAVTAIRDSGGVASYANLCGRLPRDWDPQEHGRHYCIAAPGGYAGHSTVPFWLTGPDNEEVYQASGTSFAVPVVAGAFAILKERFRNKDGTDGMNNKELIFRLMDTANRTGHGGNYAGHVAYGAGLLDIGAAIMPVGTQRMSAFGDINGGITYEFDLTSLTTSAAFGDALQLAFQTREVAAFDELDAPFWYPLSSLTPTTSSRETLQERRADLFEQDIAPVETAIGGKLALTSTHAGSSGQIDMSLRQPVDILVPQAELLLTAGDLSTAPFGLHEDESFAHPYLGFAGEGIGLGGAIQLDTGRLTAMGFTSGSADVSRDVPIDVHGGLIEYAIEPFAGIEVGVQTGAMVEESRALGLLSEGGFGELGESSTAFAGISLDSELEDSWRFRASMLVGRTNLDEPSIGLLKTSSTLTSSAFRFAVEGRDVFLDADRMDVFVAQPLRIENGKADFTVPVGRTPAGLVRREQINGVSLEPGGRELEFGMRYEMQVSEDITATGGLGIVHEGGHSKHTETEVYGLANLRFQF